MSEFHRRLKIGSAEYRALLSRLNATVPADAAKRAQPRYGFHVTDIPISIIQPEGGQSRFLGYGRNLSSHGISILHGGYVHAGSHCHVVLRQKVGSPIVVHGSVLHCRLVSGSCHEIGIHFGEEIDPSSVPGVLTEHERFDRDQSAGYQSLTGRVVLADAWDPSAALVIRQLETLGLDTQAVRTSGALIDAVSPRTNRGGETTTPDVDLVLCGLDLDTEDGLLAIETAHANRPDVAIIAMLDDPMSEAIQRAMDAGARHVIARPYPFELMLAYLQSTLGYQAPLRRIYSTASCLPGMGPLVGQYVHAVRAIARDIEIALGEKELDEVRLLTCRLRATATGYGFQDIAASAVTVIDIIDHNPAAARGSVRGLIQVCRSLAGGKGDSARAA